MLRWLLTALLILAVPKSASAVIEFVQVVKSAEGTCCSLTATMDSPTTTGNLTVVIITHDGCAWTITSVTDTGGSVYTQRDTACNSTHDQRVRIYTTEATGTRSSTSVTVAVSNIPGNCCFLVMVGEYRGGNAIGTNGNATGNSATTELGLALQGPHHYFVAGVYQYDIGAIKENLGTIRIQSASGITPMTFVDHTTESSGNFYIRTDGNSNQWAIAGVELIPAEPFDPYSLSLFKASGAPPAGGPANWGGMGFWGMLLPMQDERIVFP